MGGHLVRFNELINAPSMEELFLLVLGIMLTVLGFPDVFHWPEWQLPAAAISFLQGST